VQVLSDRIVVVDITGNTRTFLFSSLTAAQDTPTKAENFINLFLTGLSSNNYGMVCHVFSINPLVLTVATYDVDVTLKSNWWA
jgi:hypothetical protein